MRARIKVCGMKHNVAEVATLLPDYLGFIFYDKSPRNFEGPIPKIPSAIKKVGVFVNEKIDSVIETATIHKLDIIQLHGEESPEYCGELSDLTSNLEIWKVFSIGETFNFDLVKPYENIVDILKLGGVTPHIYGKKQTRPFRKMGHVTIVNSDIAEARKVAEQVKKTIKVISK